MQLARRVGHAQFAADSGDLGVAVGLQAGDETPEAEIFSASKPWATR
jgi:hypothetical protein